MAIMSECMNECLLVETCSVSSFIVVLGNIRAESY